MGLFRKRNDEQLEQLRGELKAIQEQLDRTEQANAQLESRLTELGASSATLDERVGGLDELRARVQELSGRLDSTELDHGAKPELDHGAKPEPAAPPPPPVFAPPRPSNVDDGRLDRIEERLDALDESRTTTSDRLDEIAATAAGIDERVTNISTELANQLTELSTDIDYVAQGMPTSSGAAPIDPEILEARLQQRLDEEIDAKLGIGLDEVRANAERLAMEQARYEIKFRQDLAELADRLRRPSAD
jgi:DNA repair exonuclease SbcCD ATPase subunit